MSTLNDPGFSGRHLREVLRKRPDVCAAEHYLKRFVVVHDAGVQLTPFWQPAARIHLGRCCRLAPRAA